MRRVYIKPQINIEETDIQLAILTHSNDWGDANAMNYQEEEENSENPIINNSSSLWDEE